MKAHSVLAGAVALRLGVLGALYAAASGVLLAMALPPYDVPLLGFVAFAPLLVAVWCAPRYTTLPYGLLTAITTAFVLIPTGVSSAVKLSLGARLLFFALTPSPSPTAWERGVKCVRGAARSPFPASRERGLGRNCDT